MDLGITGKVALVTASSKGLGLASARALAAEGARVVVTSRSQEALEAAMRSIDGEVHAVAADMGEPSTPARLVQETVERFGDIHIVVANNGGPPPGSALAVDDAAIIGAVNANLLASVRLVREALPHMRRNGWGRICCITSYTAKQPAPNLALSNVARSGLHAWAKTAATELFADGITLNMACPGPHATDRMRALGGRGPMGDPDHFGSAVAFLCSEPAAFITGTTLVVDGGAVAGL